MTTFILINTNKINDLNFDGNILPNYLTSNKKHLLVTKEKNYVFEFSDYVDRIGKEVEFRNELFKWGLYGENSDAGWVLNKDILSLGERIRVSDISFSISCFSNIINVEVGTSAIPGFNLSASLQLTKSYNDSNTIVVNEKKLVVIFCLFIIFRIYIIENYRCCL